MLWPGLVGIEDEVLYGQTTLRHECLACAAEDLPVLLFGEDAANHVQHDDVVAGAEIVSEHVSRANGDCAMTPALLTYSAVSGTTSGRSTMSQCTSGQAFAKAIE